MFLPPLIALFCAPVLYLIFARPRFVPSQTIRSSPKSKISVIIPARNEAENLERLLSSFAAQRVQPHEIIVVDDNSTDDTAAVATRHGTTIVSCPPLPATWKGKTWACQNGAEQASGTHLLFLDADVILLPDGFQKIWQLTSEVNTAHSICPYHQMEEPYEQLSAFFQLITAIGVTAFTSKPDPKTQALFGQCLLVERSAYSQIGGHKAVRSEILENFQLAKRLHRENKEINSYLGKDTIAMRMFPDGPSHLWNSWKKGFTAGAAAVPPKTLILTSIWLSGAMVAAISTTLLPFFGQSLAYLVLTTAAYLTYAIQLHFTLRSLGTYSVFSSIFFAIPLFFYQILFFTAIVQRRLGIKTQWKGRHVD